MSDNVSFSIPTPVGGSVNDIDGVPSILFIVMWASLVPYALRRFIVPERRTALLFASCILVMLSIVIYSLRTWMALDPSERTNGHLVLLIQSLQGKGWIVLATDILTLVRSIIGNATHQPGDLEAGHVSKQPVQSKKRKYTHVALAVFCLATPGILAAVGGGLLKESLDDESMGPVAQAIRYISAAMAALLILYTLALAIRSWCQLPRINRGALMRLITPMVLVIIILFYRFIAMANHIPSLLYTGPGSMTDTTAKVLFFILHGWTEWAACALLIIPNTHTAFGPAPKWPKWLNFKKKKQAVNYETDSIRPEPEVGYVEMTPTDSATTEVKVKHFLR